MSISAGPGDIREAKAVCAEARANFPGVEAKDVDVMTGAYRRDSLADSYIKVVEAKAYQSRRLG